MQKKSFQVAIIGAGLGGLCLAQGLKKHGIDFVVFERDVALDSRTQGYRIRINSDGQAALRRCLSPQLFALFESSCADELNVPHAMDVQLKSVAQWNDAWRSDEHVPVDLKANRHTLREVLMYGISEHVHFNKELCGLSQLSDNSVSLDFLDGTTYRADLLVGADGSGSLVTSQFFPFMRGLDTEVVCIYGKVDSPSPSIAPELLGGTSVIFDAHLAMVIDNMRFSRTSNTVLSPVNDYIYWALIGCRQRLGISKGELLLETDVRRSITEVSANWATGLCAVFNETQIGMLTMRQVRQSPLPQPWLSSRVTVLGDAAHTMSPASGLGCNTAFLDADFLTAQLIAVESGTATLDQAIASYECNLREHATAALRASERGGIQLYGGNIC